MGRRRTPWPWGSPECVCQACEHRRRGGQVTGREWAQIIIAHWTDREIIDLHAAALASML